MGNLTLVAEARPAMVAPLAVGFALEAVDRVSHTELGRLYFASYGPGVVGESVEGAVDDIRAAFAGEYGTLWPEASGVVV